MGTAVGGQSISSVHSVFPFPFPIPHSLFSMAIRSLNSGLAACSLLALLAACSANDGATADSAAAADTVANAAASATPAATSGFLDPNTATPEQLAAVPGLPGHGVAALIAGRPYPKMIDVDSALAGHLSEAARDSVYARVWMPIDLNTATGDEIMLIPGVGPRMRHEFEEYRPYANIERFRREIGKYVDSAEVARLERYVTIAR